MQHLAFDDPVVERLRPSPYPVERVAAFAVLPVAEQLGDPARLEVIGGAADHRFDECIADHAAVAVLVRGHPVASGRDDERRVRHDPVEPFTRNRFEEAAEPELHARDAVQFDVQPGDRERALRDVGRDDPLGEPGRVHGLDAAPRAEVEHPPGGRRQHEPRERRRRAADAEHVLLVQSVAEGEFAEVREDPPFVGTAGVGERIRPEVEERSDGSLLPVERRRGSEQPELRRALHPERRQGMLGLDARHGEAQHEELRERRQVGGCPVRGAARVEHAARRHPLAAMQGRRGIRSPQRLQRCDGEPGRRQVVTEPGEQSARRGVEGAHSRRVGGGPGVHPSIQAHAPARTAARDGHTRDIRPPFRQPDAARHTPIVTPPSPCVHVGLRRVTLPSHGARSVGYDRMSEGRREMAEATTIERLRQDARDELSALIELRCRLGEDPWVFLPELPSVDEQVVATLREERLHSERWSPARSRAYHPAAREGDAARFEYELLREIALDHPELSAAVWSVLDRVPSPW